MQFDAPDMGTFRDLLEQGGVVLVCILVLSTLMWALIIERYLYLHWQYPATLRRLQVQWGRCVDRRAVAVRNARRGLMAEASLALDRHLDLIHTAVVLLPMLGLLGTVIGMIHAFDALAGAGDRAGFAAGVAGALITTTAGLVTSLSGLYFSQHLKRRVQVETARAASLAVPPD